MNSIIHLYTAYDAITQTENPRVGDSIPMCMDAPVSMGMDGRERPPLGTI